MSENLQSHQNLPDAVLHDSELPIAKKPSVLLVSTSIGVLTIIALAISAYQGLTY